MSLLKKTAASLLRGQLSKLDSLYGRHSGEECYIFGSGVSLKWMDLGLFADRPSIVGNFTVYHREASLLKMPYCSIIEPYFFWPWFPYTCNSDFRFVRHHIYKEYRRSIESHPGTLFFVNLSNLPVARYPNALYVSRLYRPGFPDRNPFRDREDSHNGTLKFQISMAIFMGFRKAYLVGNDYTHSRSRTLHFYEKGEGRPLDHKGFSSDFLSYAGRHIDLVTVTLEGGSDTLDSVTYRELTGRDPRYRENTELVEREKLENLATWDGYSVF